MELELKNKKKKVLKDDNDEKEKRNRGYAFTLNNYTKEEYEKIKNIKCDYLVIGKEKGKMETPHLQGYIYIKNKISFNSVKKLLGERCHIEVANGSPEQNRKYCTKDGVFEEFGELPRQGRRTDLDGVVKMVKEKRTRKQIAMEHPVEFIKFYKGIDELRKIEEEPETWFREKERITIWFYGDTRKGKTKGAKTFLKNKGYLPSQCYMWSSSTPNFINGYNGEEVAIIDDFRAGKIEFDVLLKMCDPWNDTEVNTKHGCMWWKCDYVLITCVKCPQEEFRGLKEDINQLISRVSIERVGEATNTDLNRLDSDSEDNLDLPLDLETHLDLLGLDI